jgi:hypothetical protein
MQCLNIKNKEVAALLKEYTKIFGNEDAAYYVLSENNGYGLDKAPNGEPSKLFSDLLEHYNGDRVAAIQAKARTYSKSFKEWFGDWTGNVSIDIDSKDAIDYLYSTNTELSKVGSKEEYAQYVNSIYPNSLINSIYWHGTDSDLSQGVENTKKGKGSGAPETGAEMYFNKQPWASLQYISGVNRNIPDTEGYNNWVKLWWELKEALGNGRMDTDEWKNEIIGPNTRQYSPNKRGIFNRDKGGSNGKYLSERKARYGYQDKTDKEFFEEVFDIRYGKETFNDWVNRKKSEFQDVWESRQVKKGMYPAVLNVQNPIVEKNQNTYYEEQRGLFTKAKKDKNDAIVSDEANNEFGSDVVVIFNPKENVHFLGTKQDIENFKNWKSSNKDKTNVSKVVDKNGEPLIVYHGTRTSDGIEKEGFNSNMSGKGNRGANQGYFYFSNNYENAEYTGVKNEEIEPLIDLITSVYDMFDTTKLPSTKELYTIIDDLIKEKRKINDNIRNLKEDSIIKKLIKPILKLTNKDYKSSKELKEQYRNTINEIDIELEELDTKIKNIYNLNLGLDYLKGDRSKTSVNTLYFIKGSINSKSPYRQIAANKLINILYGTKNLKYSPKVFPVYLNIKNPLSSDFGMKETDKNPLKSGPFSEDYILYNNLESGLLKELTKPEYDGSISRNKFDILFGDVYIAKHSNQIKSIDNQGTFSTQDNNIYNQEAATQNATGRNKELALLLREIYPNIEIDALTNPNLRGQAQVEGYMAGRVLLNTLLENQDTLPHEYAHHYIAWFRNAPIVQRGIKQFGSEESLVQAIGENSVKALKWYNRFFNWVKGLFNEKQDTLNEITKAFLSGHILDNSYFFGKEIHNQKVAEIPEAVNKVYDKLMESIKRRIKDIQYAKYSDSKKVDELRALEFKLNQLENDQATFEFVDYMASDIISALNEVKALQTKVNENQKYNNPLDITSAELDMIKKGYIGFYGNIATNIQNMLDDESTFDYLNDPQLVEDTKQNLKRTVGDYYELVRNYNNLADIVAKDNFIREATKAGSFTIDHLKKILDEGDVDINLWDQWAGSTQYSNSELVRIILNKIISVKNNVAEKELEVGKELVEILSHVNKSKLAYMHERNRDGHKTGFMTRDLNYGQHYQDYLEHQRKLAEKLGFGDKDIAEVPGLLNSEQLKKWNKANNDWEAKHTIRKFTPEYYELTNSLSEEARSRRDSLNMEINLLLSTTVDKNGDYHREDLSDEDYLKLQELETRRRNLANPYYPDGSVKVGLDKEIAIEMREYNEKLREKLHYTPNMEKFNKALQKAKKNLSPEKFAKWEQRNTVDQIVEEFWDDVKTLSSNTNKSDDQILYEKARKNMLRLYTREDGKVDVDSMPDQVKSWINTYDELISEESLKTRDKSKKSKVMDIAEWEVNPRFYEELERVEKLGQAEYNAWVSINARYDYEGNLVPASFWKKLVPKKELRAKYMRKVPNRSWSEIDKESPFYDKRFTKYADRGETRIPNPELYDNSANYRKITSDSNLKKLYDKLVDVMELSNSKIQFLKYENKYRLPQIEGGAWTQIRSKDNILKGLAYAIEDTYTVKDDDNAYMLENAKRSDGSLVKLIPTRYIKMLSNPNALTNDIVGSVISYYKMAENYEQMSEIAPELEVALDFVSRTDFTDKKGGRIQGLESKTYDKLKSVLDQLVYGMEKNALELDIPLPKGKHVTVSIGKLADNLAAYTRIQGIAQNMNVILTGLITNKIQNRLEAISGIYFGNKELAQATKLIIPSYANAIKNIGHSNNKDKVLCYMEYLGVVRENAQTFSKLNQSRFLRALNQHFWYFGHEMSDYVTKGKMALAIGLYYKYDPESGKFLNKNEFLRRFKSKKEGNAKWNTLSVTFYDAFEVKNNKLVIKPEYAKSLDEATINKVRNTAKQVGTRIDTQLTDLDRSKLHATVIGQLLLIFRNFILVNLQTKFLTKRQFNYSTGMWSEAQVPAAVKYVYRHYFNQNKIDQLKELYQNHYDELDDFEKGCLKRVTYEVLFSTVGFMIISSLVRAMADDDKRNWWKQEAAYLTLRASLETRGNILPIEVINLLNTPTAAWSTLQYWGDLTTMMLNDPTQEIKKGPYKGMNRFQRSLIKATPLRSIWEAQDPRSKMEYYDNMISIFNF